MSKSIAVHTTSVEETEQFGERIGRALEPGMVVALMGQLGAGKTTLTKGIGRGLAVDDLIHSPTFNLIHEHRGRMPVYHFDIYRLTSPEQLEDLGYEDYFYGDGVTIIEWPEKVMHMLPPDHLEVRISAAGDERTFEIVATGSLSAKVLEKLNQ